LPFQGKIPNFGQYSLMYPFYMEKNESISILYVEDQADVRLFLSKILSRHYSNVFLAENGKDGLEKYQEHNPDIIISDIKMPVMDGLTMASRIKEINPKAKIILTTAHNDMEYFLHSIDIGISQYILKPIDREKLYYAINACVEQVMMERDIAKKTHDILESNKRHVIQERELRESLQRTIALKEIISKSEENFRQLAENIQDAFWLQSYNRILYVNNAFEKVFEIPLDRFYEEPDLFFSLIHPDDHQRFDELVENHMENPGAELREELKILTPSGKVKTVLYRDVHIKTNDDKKARRVIAVTDISRNKENEKLQQDLQLAEKTARIKQQFLSNMSHEMRTPMNGIIAMTEILLNTNMDKAQTDYALTIRNSADTLLDMINDLLDVTELEQGKISVKSQKTDIRQLFDRIIEYYKPQAEERKLYLNVSYDDDFPAQLFTDKQRIAQVIKNLLSNALKFTQKGGIQVDFSHKQTGDEKYEIQADIIDTGIGIEEGEQEKMFDIFTQQNQSDSRSFQGMGLGLTICREIAYLMNGHIELESTPGKGSRFSFIFPAQAASDLPGEPGSLPADIKAGFKAKILYAEDKQVNQKVVSIILENLGCEVDIAENGLLAVGMYAEKKYDLVLMDIQMPVMDGITAMKEIRSQHPNVCPIIGLSANALKADADFYINQGLDDYLSKPVTPEQLHQKIAEWLNITDSIETRKQYQEVEKIPAGQYSEVPDLDMATYETIVKQTHGDMEIISDLYGSFLDETESIIEEVIRAQKNNDFNVIKSSIHALKGLSITIGALGVHDVAFRMDALHKQDKIEESMMLLSLLQQKYQAVKSLLMQTIPLER
jgi:PAS domain S-box-containing protein